MKSMIITGAVGTLLALSGATFASEPQEIVEAPTVVGMLDPLLEPTTLTHLEKTTKLAEVSKEAEQLASNRALAVEIAYKAQIAANKVAVETVIGELLNTAGKTPYVFSGSTPYGWDCSGLVVWTYAELGIELPHSASKQDSVGVTVTSPQAGDVVLFGNSNGIFHSAIYLGNNRVIHAGFKPGRFTEVISLDNPAFNGTVVTYKRLIDLG